MTTCSYPVLLFLSQAREQHPVFCGQLHHRLCAPCLLRTIICISRSNIQTYEIFCKGANYCSSTVEHSKTKTDQRQFTSAISPPTDHTRIVAFLLSYHAPGGTLKCHTDGFESRICKVVIISLPPDWSVTDELFWEPVFTAHDIKHPCQPGHSPVCIQSWQKCCAWTRLTRPCLVP